MSELPSIAIGDVHLRLAYRLSDADRARLVAEWEGQR